MALRPRAILLITAIAALVVFAVVQDRVTAAGARRYVAIQRDAIAGRAQPVTIDQIMKPAIARSVQQGLLWSAVVLIVGVTLALASGRTNPGSRPSTRSGRPEALEGRIPDPGSRRAQP